MPKAVVATSTGNFGQGVARAAARRGVGATILAPTGSNPLKLEAMRRFGAEVRLVDPPMATARIWPPPSRATAVRC